MKRFFSALFLASALMTGAVAAETAPNYGVVNFGACLSDSKLGKQEQTSFEALKKQMTTLLEDTEKQLNELSTKFNDPEFLDGLSPEAEEELKNKFRTLNEELGRYQNQYYQVMNQANMRIMQTMHTSINVAAEKVAKEKKLTMVVNKDACFYFTPGLDVTNYVINEMDKTFAQESKKQSAVTSSEEQAVEHKPETKK